MAAIKRKKKATALVRQKDDPVWVALDERIGGREGLLEMATVSNDPRAVTLAELILDRAFDTSGTKALARRAGFTTPEIIDMYRNKKWVEATLTLHEQLPAIMTGVTDDAKPKMVPCAECKSSGKAESGDPCWVCGGWGEIRKAGDKDKLNFVGEAVGMIKKGGPAVQINTQVNTNTNSITNSFEDLMKLARVDTTKKLAAVEAEVVEEK